jgi:uncharacterized Ntn-hydrolase superfamily protein
MTYSIVAHDPETAELGVAVATRWPAVGAIVPWLEPGVGAVATQSFTNVGLGPLGLAAMRGGTAAPDALVALLADDPAPQLRQVALVDVRGRTAAHTGEACVSAAGHICEDGVSVQGNMLERPQALPQMLRAFRHTAGDLSERLLAAMRAGERSGGDVRGRSSAALLVAPAAPGASTVERRFDVRVDAAADPLDELARLLTLARAYEALDAAIAAGERDDSAGALAGTTAARALAPDDAHVAYWHALALAANGDSAEARSVYRTALRVEPRLEDLGSRFMAAGHGAGFAGAMESLRDPD